MAERVFNTDWTSRSFTDPYFEFLRRFVEMDTDGDGSISIQESRPTVVTFDRDQNGSAEIWEMAQAMKKEGLFLSCAGPSPLFDAHKIAQWKEARQFVARQGIAKSDQGAAAGVIPWFEDLGFTSEQIARITRTISSHMDDAELFSRAAEYAQVLQKLGYHPNQITELFVHYAASCADSDLCSFFPFSISVVAGELHERGFSLTDAMSILLGFSSVRWYRLSEEKIPQLMEEFRKDGVTIREGIDLVGSFLKSDHIVDISPLPAAFMALRAQGFGRDRALHFLKGLASSAWCLDDLTDAVKTMGTIGLDPMKIEVVLERLIEAAERYYGTSSVVFKGFCQLLLELDQVGLTPNAIGDLLVELSRYNNFWETYPYLPDSAACLLGSGNNVDDTSQYLATTAYHARRDLGQVFHYLPKVMRILEDEGRDPQAARVRAAQWIQELKESAADGLKLFVDLKNLGFPVPQLINFITTIDDVAGASGLENLHEAAHVLHEAGYTPEEIQAILMEVTTQLRYGAAGAAFGLFQDLKNLGCDPELIPQFLISVGEGYPWGKERFEHLKDAATVLASGGWGGDEIMEQLVSLASVLQRDTSEGFALFKTLSAGGVRPEHIPGLLIHVAQKSGKNVDEALHHLPKAVATLAKISTNSSELVNFLKELATVLEEHTGNGCRLLELSSGIVTPGDFPNLRANVIYLSSVMNGRLDVLFDLIRFGDFDPQALVRDRAVLANTLAVMINGIFEKKLSPGALRTAAQRAAVVINYLHDHDRSDDLIRRTIVERLSNRAVYFITALGGSDLYTSTFVNCFYEMRILGNRTFLDDMRIRIDPEGKYLADYILTLGGFRRFWPVFTMDPGYFTDKLFELMKTQDADALIKNTSLLLTVFKNLLEDETTAHLKPRFEAFFLEGYEAAKRSGDRVRQAVYGFVVKHEVYGKLFTDSRRIQKIHDEMPPLLTPRVPDAWLRDRTLRAKLYFYPDEIKHFRLAETMFRDKGFTVTREDQGKTIRMKKRVNGITLEVIATLERSDISRALADPTIDIVAHRGHSYHLKETFPHCQGCSGHQKLLYLGSCGSFRDVGDLMKSYAGNYFISDEDTGRGEDNNNTLATLMEAIASGERDWDRIREEVAKRYNLSQRGLIFPTDRSMLLYEYVTRFHNAGK